MTDELSPDDLKPVMAAVTTYAAAYAHSMQPLAAFQAQRLHIESAIRRLVAWRIEEDRAERGDPAWEPDKLAEAKRAYFGGERWRRNCARTVEANVTTMPLRMRRGYRSVQRHVSRRGGMPMTDDATTAGLRDAVLAEIGNCYGGALTMAYVHGWRFGGDVTADNWPVVLGDALTAYGDRRAAVARRDALREAASGMLEPDSNVSAAMLIAGQTLNLLHAAEKALEADEKQAQ